MLKTPREMFGVEPDDMFFLTSDSKLHVLAFTFKRAPRTETCCIAHEDGDRWRVVPCPHHIRELT